MKVRSRLWVEAVRFEGFEGDKVKNAWPAEWGTEPSLWHRPRFHPSCLLVGRFVCEPGDWIVSDGPEEDAFVVYRPSEFAKAYEPVEES